VVDIQSLYRKQISEKNAIFCVDQLPVVKSYNAPIRQVFQNIISNALKYSRKDHPGKIHISAREADGFWEFSVADNGIGIAKEYFDKIFIIFQRLNSQDAYEGTGMGLAVTKKIIENLGGKIWLDSVEGQGTNFHFTVPKL
jgi:signal transduction histidine kinase